MWVLFLLAAFLPTDVSHAVSKLPPDVIQATLGDIGLKEVTDFATGVRISRTQFELP